MCCSAVGRIGDSPLAGSGGWAQNDICAISTTGHGEQILRVNLAKHIALKLEQLYQLNASADNKLSNKELVNLAVDTGLNFMKDKVDGYGGVICIDKVPCLESAQTVLTKQTIIYNYCLSTIWMHNFETFPLRRTANSRPDLVR